MADNRWYAKTYSPTKWFFVPENLYIAQCKHIDNQPNPYHILTNRLLELLEGWRGVQNCLQAPVTEAIEELIKSIKALS